MVLVPTPGCIGVDVITIGDTTVQWFFIDDVYIILN